MKKEIIIRNEISQLERVASFVTEMGQELHLGGELQMNLNLVLEEMVSNIIRYGQQPADGSIGLKAESDGSKITLTLTDQGREFDPTQTGNLDTNVNPAERKTGGAGIFIVKNLMDSMTYRRQNGKNVVTLVKGLKVKG